MPSRRSLLLPIALAAAAPAHATQVCAWMDETIEPYEEEAPATEDYEPATQADDDVMTANSETAAAAAEAAAAAAEAVASADAPADPLYANDAAADATEAAADAAAAAEAAAPAAEEYADPGMHNLKLWLQADGDASFYYKMAGKGLADDDGNYGHSPNSGTYVLSRGEPSSPWGFGMTFYPPGRIDVVIEIREYPKDIFDEEDPPLLATFAFARRIPEGETQPPATLAQRQCKDITFPARED